MALQRSPSSLTLTVLKWLSIALFLFLTLYPLALMFMGSFKNQIEIIKHPWFFTLPLRFGNYGKAFAQIIQPIFNSVVVTVCVIALTLVVSSLAAFAFARYEFPGKNLLYLGILAMLMIPGFVLLIPQFITITRMGMFNTFAGLIFPPAAFSAAIATNLMRASFHSIPASLYEAAEIEGAGDLKVFLTIAVPLSKAIFATVAIITGLSAWNNFIWPLVSTSGEKVRQIAVALTLLKGNIQEGNGVVYAGYSIAAIPMITLFMFSSKYFIAGLTQGAVKS